MIDSLGTGGAERYLAEQLHQLRGIGIEPIVVSLRPRTEGVQAELQQQGFDVRILHESGLLRRVVALRRMLRAERPDVIQTVLFHSDIAGRLAAIGTGVKVISRLVNADYDAMRFHDPNIRATRFRLTRLLDGWTARHLTDQICVNSNAVKTATIRDLGVAPENVTVIQERREASRLGIPTAERRRRARMALGISDDQDVLVTIGRQDYQKGQRHLLEAMAMLVSARPHLVLLIAGRIGDASESLEYLRDRLGLSECVRFLGHRDDVAEILAAADLFVFPSFYEGLPGAVIEAMALGLPIVASDIDPVRETVEEGRNAILVTPASAPELASAIEQLLADRQTVQAYGRRSREIFIERFTLEEGMTRWMAFYRQVVSPQETGTNS